MKFLLFSLLIVLLGASCKKEKDCSESKTDMTFYVTDAVMTSTAKIGETVPISIYYDYNKGCQLFKEVTTSSDGFEMLVQISGEKNECTCSANMSSTSTTYNTKFHSSGTYTVKFPKSDGSFISKSITIQ